MVKTTDDGRYPVCGLCGEKIDDKYRTVVDINGIYHFDCHIDEHGHESALDESQQREHREIMKERELRKRERVMARGARYIA